MPNFHGTVLISAMFNNNVIAKRESSRGNRVLGVTFGKEIPIGRWSEP